MLNTAKTAPGALTLGLPAIQRLVEWPTHPAAATAHDSKASILLLATSIEQTLGNTSPEHRQLIEPNFNTHGQVIVVDRVDIQMNI